MNSNPADNKPVDNNPKLIIWSELPNADSPCALNVRQLIELCSITDRLIRMHAEIAQFFMAQGNKELAGEHAQIIFHVSSSRNGLVLGTNADYKKAMTTFREEAEDLARHFNAGPDYAAMGNGVLERAGISP